MFFKITIRTLEGGRTLIFIHYLTPVSKTGGIREQLKNLEIFRFEVSSFLQKTINSESDSDYYVNLTMM
jgi:hypothetical protein